MLGKFRMRVNVIISLAIVASFGQGCSLSSYGTQEGVLGSIAGLVVGGGIGQILGDEYGKKTENTALGAGIGAASGLALGALIHDNRSQIAKEKALVVRKERQIDDRQKEIDELREDVYSQSSWGRLEVQPWSERYKIETSEIPYQGLGLE